MYTPGVVALESAREGVSVSGMIKYNTTGVKLQLDCGSISMI
jgi:hypothetical protein